MLKYLALGDSYTIGESVAAAERWPNQLVQRLREQNIQLEEPRIIAETGWTTGKLLSAIAREAIKEPYDLVSLLVGVNNQYRGHDLDIFRQEFAELVQKAIYFARKKPEGVFVLSIPDYGVTPFSVNQDRAKIAEGIDTYNALKQEICKRLDVRFYDITAISREAATDSSLLAEDELHPSGLMYSRWVAQILPDVVKHIKMLQKV
jgi:acyl-CoA thioesterase I